MIFFQVREAHVMQDIQRKMKRSHAEYEATIQALKVHVHIHLQQQLSPKGDVQIYQFYQFIIHVVK